MNIPIEDPHSNLKGNLVGKSNATLVNIERDEIGVRGIHPLIIVNKALLC